jgi:hypothetical protein
MFLSLKIVFLLAAAILTAGLASAQARVVFVDGKSMEVQSYEVKEGVVLLRTKEGKLMSVPRSYVDVAATEKASRGGAAAAPAPRAPAATPPRDSLVRETVEPEPPVRAPEPTPPPPAAPAPVREPTPPPPPPPAAPPPSADLPASPPPVWSNEELHVSLVVPSAAWVIEEKPASFDVAASLANPSTEARATLALIRQKIRGRGDFREVVQGVERSISQAPGFRSIANGPLVLDPYTAHEFRFVKEAGSMPVFNRLAVVYSRDLAYVLSLSCPENRAEENAADFEALVRGLVVKKPRKDLTF